MYPAPCAEEPDTGMQVLPCNCGSRATGAVRSVPAHDIIFLLLTAGSWVDVLVPRPGVLLPIRHPHLSPAREVPAGKVCHRTTRERYAGTYGYECRPHPDVGGAL